MFIDHSYYVNIMEFFRNQNCAPYSSTWTSLSENVLKTGYPPFDPITGNSTAFSPDIQCLNDVQKPHERIPVGLPRTFLVLT